MNDKSEHIPYLEIEPEIAEEIEYNLENGIKHPLYTKDSDVIREEDKEHDKSDLMRNGFMRDVDKIINIPPFNRYSDKTQVFSFYENDDIQRRSLHVQIVNRIAKNIGRLLGLNVDLIEAIALGHDIGHTPFGHAGEHFLSNCLHKRTQLYFNHNINSVRVLSRIYRRNLSLQTLNGILSHNGEFCNQVLSTKKMLSFTELEEACRECSKDEDNIKRLLPSTLEGCVVRISDIIAYLGKDRYDALKIGAIEDYEYFDSKYIGTQNSQIIHNVTVDIVNNSYGKDHIEMSKGVFDDVNLAKQQNYDLIYLKEGLFGQDFNATFELFNLLFELCCKWLEDEDLNSAIYKHHINKLKLNSRDLDIYEHYLKEPTEFIATDYIAGMTDSYFISLCKKIFPKEIDRISQNGYFKYFDFRDM
ncbi:MAG: HD domain-containing protein [Eggerthellaceae bacterium]|nr:HD domain-containing protein [Eggerthellaceae bacterium]